MVLNKHFQLIHYNEMVKYMVHLQLIVNFHILNHNLMNIFYLKLFNAKIKNIHKKNNKKINIFQKNFSESFLPFSNYG